jgi:hypothetical protein
MPPSRKLTSRSLAAQAAELALAVPQVVAHRMTRMALAGPRLSPRDRKEFELMMAEKHSAFSDSWQAMTAQAVKAQHALAASFYQSMLAMSRGARPANASTTAQLQRAALEVLGKGLAPVHRKAVANAKRLGRIKIR